MGSIVAESDGDDNDDSVWSTGGLNTLQFMAVVHWVSTMRGITYSECVERIINFRATQRQKIATVFAEFVHCSSRALMTVFEFTRFCKHFGFFVRGRLVEGDIYTLFKVGGEGKVV